LLLLAPGLIATFAGLYGAAAGLQTPACSGVCSAGYYCPQGSTSSTQVFACSHCMLFELTCVVSLSTECVWTWTFLPRSIALSQSLSSWHIWCTNYADKCVVFRRVLSGIGSLTHAFTYLRQHARVCAREVTFAWLDQILVQNISAAR
jgi:hypothetical protein